MPLFGAHPRKCGVVVNAGIVDQDLNRTVLENFLECSPGSCGVGQVELQGARLAPAAGDAGGYRLRGGNAAMGVDVNIVAPARSRRGKLRHRCRRCRR